MSVAARVAVFQLLVMGGVGTVTPPPAFDYDIAPATEFTSRKRRSILSGAPHRASFNSRARGTLETAADRATGFTAPKRTTLETN